MKASLDYYTRSSGRTSTASCASSRSRRTRSTGARTRRHDRLRGARLHHPRQAGRGRPDVLRDRARGRAQWWGGQVRGASCAAAAFLSESLANYSAMMVTEKTHGPEAARRVYDFQMDRYLSGRASNRREVPLLEVEDQPYIAYGKGAVAMYTLREHPRRRRGQRGAAPLSREVPRRRAAVPDVARSVRRAARRHARLARSTCSRTCSRRSRCGTSKTERAVVAADRHRRSTR